MRPERWSLRHHGRLSKGAAASQLLKFKVRRPGEGTRKKPRLTVLVNASFKASGREGLLPILPSVYRSPSRAMVRLRDSLVLNGAIWERSPQHLDPSFRGPRITQVEPLEPSQSMEVDETFIADLRVAEAKVLQIGQPCDMRQASAADLRAPKVKLPEVFQRLQTR
jgi:hypothetical protein